MRISTQHIANPVVTECNSSMNETIFCIDFNLAYWAMYMTDLNEYYPATLRAKAFECADHINLADNVLANQSKSE